MTTKLTIAFTEDVLKALKKNKALRLSLAGSNGRAAPARAGRKPATKAAGRRGGRRARAAGGAYGDGSPPARLVAWASGRKRAFGVSDVMRALGVQRSHANMVLTRVVRDRKVKRQGRGEYAAA
ncbi:MAG: hypothetical protein ACT4PV_14825 [Planctomycetaceae bacterium]